MATSGALGGFLDAMLQLRSQRLQEAQAKARAQEEMMKGIGQGIGSLGEGIGKAMKQGREDTSANKLMTEYFGKPVMRAQAAGKGVQSAADLAASQMPGGLDSGAAFGPQFTGGKEELAQRMELEKMRGDIQKGRAADLWKSKNYELAVRNSDLTAARDQRMANKDSYANQLMAKAPQAAKDILTTSLAVQAKQDSLMEQMQKDMANDDFESYQTHARELRGYQEVHKSAKLTGALADVPPFVGARQAKKFAELAAAGDPQALAEAQQEVTGAWMDPKSTALPENTASYSLRSAGPKKAPVNQVLDPAMLQRMAQRGQFTQQEAQQVIGQQPPPAAAGPPAAAAPGARPIIYKNNKTGERGVWNYQTGKMEPIPTGQ